MRSTDFLQQNVIFAINQPPYLPLAAYRAPDDPTGRVVTRWRPSSWSERLRLIFNGSVWVETLTFNEPLQPIKVIVRSPFDDSL